MSAIAKPTPAASVQITATPLRRISTWRREQPDAHAVAQCDAEAEDELLGDSI
jgi:hypothetical protein